MDVLCSEFKDHYHLERPHQGMENETLIKPTNKGERTSKRAKPSDTIRLGGIRCKERLGGLLKRYSHAAYSSRQIPQTVSIPTVPPKCCAHAGIGRHFDLLVLALFLSAIELTLLFSRHNPA